MKEVLFNERGCCEGGEENWWEMIDLTCLEIITWMKVDKMDEIG